MDEKDQASGSMLDKDDEEINVNVWLDKIKKGREKEQRWRPRAKRCMAIYRDDPDTVTVTNAGAADDNNMSFNILWANTETLLPALFSSMPKPDVRSRHLIHNKASQVAAQVIERCLVYLMDKNKFERIMKAGIKEHLLTGRVVTRVRLEPVYEDKPVIDIDESGQIIERVDEILVAQNALIENTPWDGVTFDPDAKTWEEVRWICFSPMLFKEEYEKYFPGMPLSTPSRESDQDTNSDKKYAETKYKIHEIWDKNKKRVIFLGEGVDKPLKVLPDPLGLEEFWPIPQPLYSIETNDTLVPIPEYTIYQQQATELDSISYRITDLVKACKFIGVYDAMQSEIGSVLKSRDSQFIPVSSNMLRELGIKGVMDVVDVSPIARVLQQLYVQRDQIKSIIYEITGISDIIRGDSVASETATAQNIKSKWAGLRLRDRRSNINRFIVDTIRMQAQLLGKFFDEKQLGEMSGIKLDYSQEPMPPMPMPPMQDPYLAQDPSYAMQFQQQMMQFQESQSIYQAELEKRQEAQDVMRIIKDDLLMCYNIDIETDSTILADMEMEAQKRASLVTSITQFIATTAPLVQMGAMPIETAKALLMFALQTTKIPRELEDAIELIGSQPPPPMGMPGMTNMGQPMPQMPPQGTPQQLPHPPQNQELDIVGL